MDLKRQTYSLSVIIPVHDAAQFLSRCLDSVLTAQGDQYEVIAINDGSTDGSGEILAAYASRYPSLRVDTFTVNRGVAAARNRGLDLATGDFILFVDADDRLLPGAVPRIFDVVMPHAPDISMFLHQTIMENGKLGERDSLPEFLSSSLACSAEKSNRSVGEAQFFFDLRNPVERRVSFDLAAGNLWAWNGLFRREALRGLRFGPLTSSEDFLFGAQAYCRAESFAALPLIVYEYLPRCGSLSQRNSLLAACDSIHATARFFESVLSSGFYLEVSDLVFRKLRTLAFGTTLDRLLRLPHRERQAGWNCWFGEFKSVFQAAGVQPRLRCAIIRFCLARESPLIVCLLLRTPVRMKARILALPGVRRWWLAARQHGIERGMDGAV